MQVHLYTYSTKRMLNNQPMVTRYSFGQLFAIRRCMSSTRFIANSVKQTLLDNILLHRRGCRGGSRKQRPIQTISVRNVLPRKRASRVQDRNCRCLATIGLEQPAADVTAAGSDGSAEA